MRRYLRTDSNQGNWGMLASCNTTITTNPSPLHDMERGISKDLDAADEA
jgi:hypothetical protein